VKRRLISDVPLGAFLSGGLDSSAVVAAMAQLQGANVHAVTIGFKGWEQSEVDHARLVAQALGVQHVVHELEPAAIELVDSLAEFFDEPFSDPSAIPTFLLAREARKSVTVALAGDGGDECFAGYRRYRFDLAEHRVRSLLPGPLFRQLFRAGGALWPKGDWLPRRLRAKTTLQNLGRDPAAAYFRSVSQMEVAEARALLHPDCARRRPATTVGRASPLVRGGARRRSASAARSTPTSTPGCPSTCWRRATARRWRSVSRRASRCSTGVSSSSRRRCRPT
jgi:asparagine synthase (glutamine-hydrolysing)